MNKLRTFLEKNPNAKILDIGTGVGSFIHLITSLYDGYATIVGIDLSENALAAASKNFAGNPRITFEKQNAMSMSFPDASFDIVCLSNSLHHLTDIPATLLEMRRVVKPTGAILINEMRSDELSETQISHRMLHHFAAEIDRSLGQFHDETYSRETILSRVTQDTSLQVDEVWSMELPQTEPATLEEIEQLCTTVDRQMNRIKDETFRQTFHQRGESIKTYIRTHGFDGATQLLIVLRP